MEDSTKDKSESQKLKISGEMDTSLDDFTSVAGYRKERYLSKYTYRLKRKHPTFSISIQYFVLNILFLPTFKIDLVSKYSIALRVNKLIVVFD